MVDKEELTTIAHQHYQAGRLVEAEAAYRQVLQQQPDRVEALSWLALIADQLGRLEDSAAYYTRLLQLKPDAAETHSNLGAVLSRLGQMEAAIAHHQQAVSLMPADADAHYNLAVTFYQNRQVEAAIHHYRQAIAINPNQTSAQANLALALYAQGRLDEAIHHYRQALVLNPDHVNANNGLAVALYHQGELAEAKIYCERAISLDPNYFSAYNNLGTILQKQGRLNDAKAQYQKALSLNPNYASAYDNLGTIFQEQKNIEQAIVHYRRAIALEPNSANAFNNLGSALKEQGRLAEAIACCQQAIRLQPNHADAHNNYASSLVEQGKFREAIGHYQEAIRHRPEHVNAHLNLGIILLMLGDFQQGFPEYHWRWRSQQCPSLRYPNALWDGSDLTGKIILLTAEQGFGDTIQFARYAPLVAQRGGCVVVACQKPLLRLLATLPGIDRCVDRDQVDVETHCHAPLLDLPMILGTTVDTIPGNVPYLSAPESDVVKLFGNENARARAENRGQNVIPPPPSPFPHPSSLIPPPPLPPSPPLCKIGITWASNPDNATSKKRSATLDHFLSLLQVPGVVLYSLQKEPPESDLAILQAHPEIVDLRQHLHDFGDTAAAIAQLDLVVSVDTAVAHLAGALGKPVWTLLPFVADWRWLTDRHDTPWYPTMRLFRQRQEGDWEDVFEHVRVALQTGSAATIASKEGESQGAAIQSLPLSPSPTPPLPNSPPPLNTPQLLQDCRHGTFLCHPDDPVVGQSLSLYGEWMEGEVALFQSLLRPGDTVIEAGAGIGAHTVMLANTVGVRGSVWAIEPQRLPFQLLCANLALNGITNTYAQNAVLGEVAGFTSLTNPEFFREPRVDRIPVVTLDNLNLPTCRLITLVVGATSLSACKGATAIVQRFQPVLYLRNATLEGSHPLIQYLMALGYELYWHRPPLYHPNNFRNNSHNRFGEQISVNILGFHRTQGVNVEGMPRISLA